MRKDRREFFKLTGAAGAGLIASGGITSAAEKAKTVLHQDMAKADSVTELFLDNQMIEVSPGVSRVLHPARKHLLNPVVKCDRWCDGNIIQPYTTMYDHEDKLFKMWARTGTGHGFPYVDGHAAYMTYLTSTDGVNWNKPELGVIEVAGRRDHNIVFNSDSAAKSIAAGFEKKSDYVLPTKKQPPQGKKAFFWGVNKHPNPRNASEKFVALAIVQDHRRGAHIVTSPDGIQWSCASSPFWQTPHDVSGTGDDCLMHLMFDKLKKKWVIYRRIVPEFSERMVAADIDCERKRADRYYRSYAYAESDDLIEWNNHQHILSMDPDDPPDTELYQFGCYQLGQTYVGFMSVFYRRIPQPINIHLTTSRDGINFTRVCRGEPFIPHGLLGYYDYMAMSCSQPEPIVVDDTVYVYYAGLNFPHNGEVSATKPAELHSGAALATFKRDRYASLSTSDLDPGPSRIITKPFVVHHPRLYLNAATWMRGSIHIEVLTPDWQPVEGFTQKEARGILGDALNHPVQWKKNTDLSQLLGKEIRLKFYMDRARVYTMTLSKNKRKLGPVKSEAAHGNPTDSVPIEN